MKSYIGILSVVILLCPTAVFSAEFSNFGFYGFDPHAVRQVVCIDTPAWPAADCIQTASKAIYAINTALGWEHFEFSGVITPEGAQNAYDSGVFILAGLPSDREFLAVTVPRFTSEGKIEKAMTLMTPAALHGEFPADTVLTHELIHSMGVEHAPCMGAWGSVMAPAENCPTKIRYRISRGDVATLRRAYPNPSWWRS